MSKADQKPDYHEQREILIAYLMAKVHIGDWHGVSDAANDLRVLEATEDGRIKAELTWTHHKEPGCTCHGLPVGIHQAFCPYLIWSSAQAAKPAPPV